MKCAVTVLFRLLLRAGMTASRLYHRRHVIPAQTDHLEDKGGVIGAAKLFSRVDESFVILGQSFGLMRPQTKVLLLQTRSKAAS